MTVDDVYTKSKFYFRGFINRFVKRAKTIFEITLRASQLPT